MEDSKIPNHSAAEHTPPGKQGGIISEHIVEETDTLPEIASKYNISIDDLLAANSETISNRSEMMKPGTRIMIPNKHPEE